MYVKPTLDFFQIGGSLPSESPSYVKRRADDDLLHYLKNGQFCYVLTARQMGKSSLRVQTMKTLSEHGFLCSAIDLTAIGSKNITPEQWYYSLIDRIASDLDMYEECEDWWVAHEKLTPVSRFVGFVEQVILEKTFQPIVIFIDEIDTVLSLNSPEFNTDDFFALIRSFYNSRNDNPNFNRLNFTLLGVASPDELVRDPARTPFNIGIPIHLENFLFEESKDVLTQGFSSVTTEPEKLLKAIFDYTSGHPYLTQKVCATIIQRGYISNIEEVTKQLVHLLFFNGENGELDANLANIQNRIIAETRYGAEMLQVYQELLNRNSIILKRSDPVQIYLRLSGLVSESKGFLKIDNKIYEQFFSRRWAVEMLKKMDRPYTVDMERWINSGKTDPSTANTGNLLRKMIEWSKTTTLTNLEKDFILFCQEVDKEERDRAHKAEEIKRTEIKLKQERKNNINLKRRNIGLIVAFFALAIAFSVIVYYQRRYINANKDLAEKEFELTKREEQYDQLLQQIDEIGDERKAKEDSVLALQMKLKDLQAKYGDIINRVETSAQNSENDNKSHALFNKMISNLRADTMNLRAQIRALEKKTELVAKPIPEQLCRGAKLAFWQLEYGEGGMYDQGLYKTLTNRVSKALARELQENRIFTNSQLIKDYREKSVALDEIKASGYEGYITGNIIATKDPNMYVIRVDVYLFSQVQPCTSFPITSIPKDLIYSNSLVIVEALKVKLREGIKGRSALNQQKYRIQN
jgi:hypothetical protein